jgi:hypothetical protein
MCTYVHIRIRENVRAQNVKEILKWPHPHGNRLLP